MACSDSADPGSRPAVTADSDSGAEDSGAPGRPPAGALVLDHAVVVDASGARERAAVILTGDTIWAVTDAGQDWPSDVTVRDLDGASVVPGLIDSHVHLFHSGAMGWVGDTLAANLSADLSWGVTGVADLGAPVEIFALRDRIASGEITGPRIFATGPFLTAELSHPCETVNDPTLCTYVNGDGAARVAALAEADGVKVALADAGFTDWPTPRLDLGDLADITGAAAAVGQTVFAHIDEGEDAADALAAGVGVLAHPVFGERLRVAPHGVTLSTLGAFSGVGAVVDGSLLDEDLRATPAAVVEAWTWWSRHPDAFLEGWVEGNAAWADAAAANLALGVAQGETILAGSDAGYWFVPHGVGLHRELSGLVEAGMSPLDALAAATSAPAALLGWTDLGFVAEGYRADLLIVSGRPDQDIGALRQIEAVYLGGALWQGGALREGGQAAEGGFCLEDADCEGACDLVAHTCARTCDEPYDRVSTCGPEAWCRPADGLDTNPEGVCAQGAGCDLYAQDCAPASYGENCAPADLDTNVCWPAGPRGAGASCSWSDASLYCEQGLYCSWVDYTCYQLCDPDGPATCARCVTQTVEGAPWFGLCL